jgi:chloride channel 3/4/5
MKRELHTLAISGTIQEVETLLNSTAVKGFPIVTDDAHRTLVGYIGRREVRYVIGMFLTTFAWGMQVYGSIRQSRKSTTCPARYDMLVCC